MKCPLLLDANAMISLFEGSDPELERALCSAEELVVPVVAYAEVVAGTEMDTKRAKMTREALLMLLATPNTRLLPVSEATVRHYSRTFNFSSSSGCFRSRNAWSFRSPWERRGRLGLARAMAPLSHPRIGNCGRTRENDIISREV